MEEAVRREQVRQDHERAEELGRLLRLLCDDRSRSDEQNFTEYPNSKELTEARLISCPPIKSPRPTAVFWTTSCPLSLAVLPVAGSL